MRKATVCEKTKSKVRPPKKYAQAWAKADPSIYAQCFTGQTISTENWCSKCQCLDHTSSNCPYLSRKHSWSTANPQSSYQGEKNDRQICIKYNRFNGDCKFGKECRFSHVCSKCKEPHPVSKCKASGSGHSTHGNPRPSA